MRITVGTGQYSQVKPETWEMRAHSSTQLRSLNKEFEHVRKHYIE